MPFTFRKENMAGISIGFSEIFGQQATTSNIQIKIRTRREEGANVTSVLNPEQTSTRRLSVLNLHRMRT